MNFDILKKQLDNCEVLFTDIFDTIIYRKNFPDYNKKIWCESVKRVFGINKSVKQIINIRQNAEIELRKLNKKNGYDFEFSYNQLVQKLYKKFKIKEPFKEFSKICKDLEINIEFSSQEIFDDALKTLEYCKKKKIKVICVSDMYLTKDMINVIFEKHNISDYFYDINISSEKLLCKSSGRLYDYLKKKYKDLNFDKALMIGDNYDNDYKMPLSKQINALNINRYELFQIYKNRAARIENRDYLKKLMLTKSFFDCFDDELELYFSLLKVSYYLFKNNVSKIEYTDETKDIISRLNLVVNESYFSNRIEFIKSKKNTLVFKDDNGYIFKNINSVGKIKHFDGNFECFITIVNNLINVALDYKISSYYKKSYTPDKPLSYDLNVLEELGKSYSPIFEDFARWINRELKNNNIKKIFFFTREGEFFKKVFDLIKDKNISSEILEVSRVATFFPSFDSVNIDEMQRIWSQYKIQSLSAMFKSLNVNPLKYSDIVYKYNLNFSDPIIKPWKNFKIISLFNDKDFKKMMTEDLNNAKENLFGYFKEHGFDNNREKIAIVDIGWRGTIQDNICKIFNNKEIYGYYFGMQKFLNEQPKNSQKFGYINQYYGAFKVLGDVTPFEMLCNSCNGSTLGYELNNGKYSAIRKIDSAENQIYFACTKYVQEGILKNIGKEEYSSEDPINALEKIIYKPHKMVTNAYFNLKHNEEFGLGEFVSKKCAIPKKKITSSINNSYKADLVRFDLQKTTWPNGYLINNNLEEYIDKLPLHHLNRFDKVKVTKKIAFILPDLLEGSGGHRTIIENANFLAEKGYQVDLYFNEDYISTSDSMFKKVERLFDRCLCQVYIGTKLRTDYDMVFATYNVITPEIVNTAKNAHKMYFVQDFEPWFNAMGDGYISAENTYKLGFRCITIGNWLSHKLLKEFHVKSSSFPFCANLSVYHPINIEKEDAVCFVFQPDKSRRCVDLGLKALRIVKKLRPNVKIYLYGSKQYHYVDFEHENLKIININKCNELYNKCRVGLCISSSNPSRIPFEMMASGCAVVDVYRENNLYDMPSEGVTLADSTPESIANEIINLLDNPKLADKKAKFGINYMKDFDLSVGFETFYNQVKNILDGKDVINQKVEKMYDSKPSEISNEVMEAKKINDFYGFTYESSDYYRERLNKKINLKLAFRAKHKYLYAFLRLCKRTLLLPKRILRK